VCPQLGQNRAPSGHGAAQFGQTDTVPQRTARNPSSGRSEAAAPLASARCQVLVAVSATMAR
jgi:hypothetical protein